MTLIPGLCRLRRACTLLALLLGCACSLARADDLDQVRQLQAAGHLEQALQAVRGLIRQRPGDPQYQLTEALILQQQHHDGQAIELLRALIRRYPELPEPYNNLAVLYAARGETARALQSLEMALRANPDYATARANLGDVYLQLAEQAYRRAAGSAGDAAARAHAQASLRRLQAGPDAAPPMPVPSTGTARH
jgi:tetratricopeptide (TPR) repeat protein